MMVQAQEDIGEGSANPTDPHHTPTITQPSTSQPQKTKHYRKPRRNITEVPYHSDPTSVVNKAINEEMDDNLEREATTITSLDAEVLNLETIKITQAMEIESLKRRVKKLERTKRSRTHKLKRLYKVRLSARVESSEDKEKRRKFFAVKRPEEKRNKPPTQAQQRKIMYTYLKNMEGKKLTDLKNMYFNFVQKMFDRAFKTVNTFVDYRTELVKESFKKDEEEVTEGSSKRAGTKLEQESVKKQKIDDDKDTTELKDHTR
nr:hypothetical protein [Tanacetum cinerariifolium]